MVYVGEVLVQQALANGKSVSRRSSAPPAAILQVRVVQRAAAPSPEKKCGRVKYEVRGGAFLAS